MKGFKLSPIHLPPIKKAKVKTVKHTAGFLTILGGVAHFTPFYYMEAAFFMVAGLIAIYEPYFAAGESV